ncbi:antimicrobial peptide NK-lysin isoform X4 [Misgurnus anguillicaudatus]|uniref:antimicrobial peptide NK-lysin isoform X4 n=1 Tax=Misgurnus anguillicaudatus TaxID=75329 RepID=UPI003CCF526F
MLRFIIFVTLLVSSVCALQREMDNDGLTEKELEEIYAEFLAKTGHKFPGICWACKWAMGKIKRHISVTTNKAAIKRMLHNVCNEIGFLKYLCRGLVSRFLGPLIEELSTTDNPAKICSHIGVC